MRKDNLSIDLKNLSFEYNSNKKIFDHINLSIKDGFYYINGDSGVGKTTLLQLLSGWLPITSGKIVFRDKLQKERLILDSQNSKAQKQLNYFRQQTGIIFQDFKLKNDLSAYDNVFDFVLMRQKKITSKQRKSGNSLLKILGFNNVNELKYKKVSELSGGEKQRIAIARGLMIKPKFVFADEITSNLGLKDTARVVRLLEDYAIKNHAIVIFATHDKSIIKHCPYPTFVINKTTKKVSKWVFDKDSQKMTKLNKGE